jgi:hypothetical protein
MAVKSRKPKHRDTLTGDRRRPVPVTPWAEWCESIGISLRTGRRLREKGMGPRVVELSPHKIGVRDDDGAEWLATRPVR